MSELARPVIEVLSPGEFDGVVADEIVATISDAVSARGRASVAIAGGSTPAAIYRLLVRPPRVTEMPWSSTSFYFGDERWVPHDHEQSNFRMATETIFSGRAAGAAKVFGIPTNLVDPAAGAAEYSLTLQKNEGGVAPILDLVLLGVGEDGHTASIFPGSSAVFETKSLVVAVKDPIEGRQRVSLTSAILFSARRIIFIAKGEAKSSVLQRVIEGSEGPEILPACLFRPAADRVRFFLDSGAAKRLGKAKAGQL